MKPVRCVAVLLGGMILGPALFAAEETAPEKTGLPVGKKAPSFTLKDQNGQDTSLDSLLRKGPVALVFHRSADW